MKRSAPMKRTAFKSKLPPQRAVKTYEVHTPKPRTPALLTMVGPGLLAAMFRPQPKDNVIEEHGAYMALVRKLPCARCGDYLPGFMQFCHADILGKGGKGKGLKSDCRLGWPGCAPCHYYVGSTGRMPKAKRHAFEARAGTETRQLVFSRGLWPASLPLWHDLETNHAEETTRTETAAIPA